MNYPIFRDAKCTIKNNNDPNFKFLFKFCLKIIIYLCLCLLSLYLQLLLLKFIINYSFDNALINIFSISTSLITVFSAIIAFLSILDADCLKKYDNNLYLLESRYLKGKKISGWEFFHRNSLFKSKSRYCYQVASATYSLYCGNTALDHLCVVIPALEVDFHDLFCLKEIISLKKFLPRFIHYIEDECTFYKDSVSEEEKPDFYIALPYIIIALYKKILGHKIMKFIIHLLFILIITSILALIISYLVNFKVLSSQ